MGQGTGAEVASAQPTSRAHAPAGEGGWRGDHHPDLGLSANKTSGAGADGAGEGPLGPWGMWGLTPVTRTSTGFPGFSDGPHKRCGKKGGVGKASLSQVPGLLPASPCVDLGGSGEPQDCLCMTLGCAPGTPACRGSHRRGAGPLVCPAWPGSSPMPIHEWHIPQPAKKEEGAL